MGQSPPLHELQIDLQFFQNISVGCKYNVGSSQSWPRSGFEAHTNWDRVAEGSSPHGNSGNCNWAENICLSWHPCLPDTSLNIACCPLEVPNDEWHHDVSLKRSSGQPHNQLCFASMSHTHLGNHMCDAQGRYVCWRAGLWPHRGVWLYGGLAMGTFMVRSITHVIFRDAAHSRRAFPPLTPRMTSTPLCSCTHYLSPLSCKRGTCVDLLLAWCLCHSRMGSYSFKISQKQVT